LGAIIGVFSGLAFENFEMMWIACAYMFITWIYQTVDEWMKLKK